MRWTRCRSRRTTMSRTAKSCGPGAPTLALNSPRAQTRFADDGGKKARFTEEITYKPLKPLRREGRLIRFVPVVLPRAFFCTRTMGACGHPAFPAPSRYDEGGS